MPRPDGILGGMLKFVFKYNPGLLFAISKHVWQQVFPPPHPKVVGFVLISKGTGAVNLPPFQYVGHSKETPRETYKARLD